jgi:RHS repeat-associated protein
MAMGSANGQVSKLYWYGKGEKALDETDQTGSTTNSGFNEYVFLGGQLIARRDSAGDVFFYFADDLGTSRALAEVPAGQTTATLCYDADFYPFGGERSPVVNTCSQNYKFNAKERDPESGLDNFGSRYDSSSVARFMSTDPSNNLALRIVNPQRWNKYAYALDNPLSFSDPDGRDAAAVNFTGMVGGFGHEGILTVSRDGTATYAAFRPEDHSLSNFGGALAPGVVDVRKLDTTVQFGDNGLPTDESLEKLGTEVASIEGVDPATVRVNYFQTGSADTAALNSWINQQQVSARNGTGQYCGYAVAGNNCATFTEQALVAGRAITARQARRLSIIPNSLYGQLFNLANLSFDLLMHHLNQSRACTTVQGPEGPITHCEYY